MTWSKFWRGTPGEIREQVEESDIPQPAKAFLGALIPTDNDAKGWNVTASGHGSRGGDQISESVNASFVNVPDAEKKSSE